MSLKDGMADSFSERTYNNENTPYNIELNRLRSHLPDVQPARPRSMEYGYNSRYDNINNAPAEKSSKGMNRAERVFATMCCGSCLCFLLWIVVSLLVVGAFAALLVKVLHHPTIASPVASATSIPAMEPSTTTVTQSATSDPISTITASSITTDTTTFSSVSTLTTVIVSIQTYTPQVTTFTVTSERDGTTEISTVTSGETTTTTQSPIPTSVITQTSVIVTSVDVTTTATSSVMTTSGTTATSTITTTTRNHNDNDDDEISHSWPASENLRALESRVMSLEDQENKQASTWDRFKEHPENIWENRLVNTVEKVKAWCATRSEDFDNVEQLSSYCEAIPAYEYIHVYTATGNRHKRCLASPYTTDWTSQDLDHRTLQPAGAIFVLPSLTTSTFLQFSVQSLTAASDQSKTTTSAETTTPLSVLRFQLSSHIGAINQSPTGAASKSIHSEYDDLNNKYGSVKDWCNSHSAEISTDAAVSEICFDTWAPTTIKPSSTASSSFARDPAAKTTKVKSSTSSSSFARGPPATTTHRQVRAEKEQPHQSSTSGHVSSIQSDTNTDMSDRHSVELADQRTGESESIASSPKTYPVVFPVTESGHNYAYVTSMYSKALAYMSSHSADEQLWKSADANMLSYSYQLADIRHWCHTALTWNADPDVTTYCDGMPKSELLQKRMVTTSTSDMLRPTSAPDMTHSPSIAAAGNAANSSTDNTTSETGSNIHTRPGASTPAANDFPVTENLGAISAKITSYEGYISKHSSTNAAIADPVADALSTVRDEHSSVASWCSEHNTDGAALSIKSYCGPNASLNTRRDVLPTITISGLDDVETTLITKYISVTNIVTITSTTSLSTINFTASEQSTQSSQPISSRFTPPNTLDRRKDILAAWGVTNLHHPAEIGTNILRLPPHQWDCVRRPRSCVTILSLLGALCGIPFGMILLVLFRACWRCCMKRRAEERFEEERKKKPGLDAAIEKLQLNKLGARLGGEWSWAGSGGKKKGRRASGATIYMGEDGTY